MRELTYDETAFISNLAAMLDRPEAERLLTDMRKARAEPVLDDGALVIFDLEGYVRPASTGQHTYPVEGTMRDADGEPVTVLLLADPDDRLFQLEFIRWTGGSLVRPNWASLELKVVHPRNQ